jgi:hypothetical protein
MARFAVITEKDATPWRPQLRTSVPKIRRWAFTDTVVGLT